MEGLRRTSVLLLIIALLQQVPTFSAMGSHKMLNIPEKIIGGVIDIVQNHKNKPSQQATFQQNVQTQTTFSQQGNPVGTVPPQTWTGPGQGTTVQGQAQFQAQGQYANNYGNYGTGANYQPSPPAPAPIYPANSGQVSTGVPVQYPVNPAPYQPQQSFTQSQNQGQYQGQYQNQNQQNNFQNQGQSQNQNQFQSGQYGSGNNYQGTGQYVGQNGGNYNGGQASSGNYQTTGGNYQGGQTSGGNYQVPVNTGNYQGGTTSGGNYQGGSATGGNYQGGQASGGNYHGQNVGTGGNYPTVPSGQYQGTNGQYNQGSHFVPQPGNQQSGYYQGQQAGQHVQGQSGSQGSYGGSSEAFQGTGHQPGGGPTCVCQAWTKPPAPLPAPAPHQAANDEIVKSEKSEKNDESKPAV